MSNFRNITKKKLIAIIALIVVVVAIPLTVIISQQQQDVRQRASGNETSFYFSQTDENTPITQVTLGNNQQTTAILYLDTKGQAINAFDITIDAENNPDLIRIDSFQEGEGAAQFENEVTKIQTGKKVQISKLTTDTNKIIMGKLKIGSVTFTTIAEGQGAMRVKDIVITSPLNAGASLTADTPSLPYTISQATSAPPTNTPAPIVPGTVSLTLSPSIINITQPTEQDFTATYTMAGICDTRQSFAYFRIGEGNNGGLNEIRNVRNQGGSQGDKIQAFSGDTNGLKECSSTTTAIDNNFLNLDCSRTTVSCSSDTLTISAHATIKTAGNYKGYLRLDKAGVVDTGMVESGTVWSNATPTPSPSPYPVKISFDPQTKNVDLSSGFFIITAKVDAGHMKLSEISVKAKFDPQYLERYSCSPLSVSRCSVTNGHNFSSSDVNSVNILYPQSGEILFAKNFNDVNNRATGNFDLFSIKFIPKKQGNTSLTFEESTAHFVIYGPSNIQNQGSSIEITVPPTTTPLPTATLIPTNTPTSVPGTATPTPSVTYLAEDVNRSGCVDIFDFNILLSAIRRGSAQTGTYPDINNNGTIDIFDFNLWLNAFRAGRGRCQ